jgi:hypothetical protein
MILALLFCKVLYYYHHHHYYYYYYYYWAFITKQGKKISLITQSKVPPPYL